MDDKLHRPHAQPPNRPWSLRWLMAPLLLCAAWAVGARTPTLAQIEDLAWSTPENLSRSGAASSPVMVLTPNGDLRVLWWDQFDGLMVADGTLATRGESDDVPGGWTTSWNWSAPEPAPIVLPQEVLRDGVSQVLPLPIEVMPYILADAEGQAHAFWLGDADRETGDQSLLYGRLSPGRTAWSSPRPMVEAASSFDATVDESGALHLVYVQPTQAGERGSGLYYERSRDGGGSWSSPTLVSDSLYLRLLTNEERPPRLTADSRDSVFITWIDQRSGQVLVTHTSNGGTTWDNPRPYTAADGNPLQTRVVAAPDRVETVLWKPGDEQAGLVAASGKDHSLMLAYWQNDQWATTIQVALRLQDPDLGDPLSLTNIRLALLPSPSGQDRAVDTLALVGLDQRGDVWITGIPVDDIERLATPSAAASAAAPTNLSQGGSSSRPIIVGGTNDTVHAFWWDQYQGLMTADGVVTTSTSLSAAEESVTAWEVWGPARPVPLPVQSTPQILAGVTGTLHAFWLDEPGTVSTAEGFSTASRVMYSQLEAGGSVWSPPIILAEGVTGFEAVADATGALHIAYVQTLQMPYASPGVYYRRSEPDGIEWKAPVAVQLSGYLRALSLENTYLDLAIEQTGGIYVTWDDVRQARAQLAFSPDGGDTWPPPVAIGDPLRQAFHGRLVTVSEGQTLVLWEAGQAGGTCSLYQAPALQVLQKPNQVGDRVLDSLITCPQGERILQLGKGLSMMAAGAGSDALTLAIWDGQRWSEPRLLSFDFQDPDSGGNVYLVDLGFDLVARPAASGGEVSNNTLIVVGIGGSDDVWATSSQMGELGMLFSQGPDWTDPMSFAESEELPGLPAMALDAEGGVHLLWSEVLARAEAGTALRYARRDEVITSTGNEGQWTSPAIVLLSPEGGAVQPSLVAAGDQLHTVWSGGLNGQVLHSQTLVRDAYTASGWEEPRPLPAPGDTGSWPDIVTDPAGTVHVVYAVPLNEKRGIYYTHSDDGKAWSEPSQVFDAVDADWARCDHPHLAVDVLGVIHAVWVRGALLGDGQAQGIYYAQSRDGGRTWSEAVEVVAGAYDWPLVATGPTGQVHLLWNEQGGASAWWHRWSTDGGSSWTRAERVPVFEGVQGPAELMGDGSEALHLVGLGSDEKEEPALFYGVWNGQRWGEREMLRLDLGTDEAVPGVSAGLQPALGQMDVVFRGVTAAAGETPIWKLWHTRRKVTAPEESAATAFAPELTAMAGTTPVPTNHPMPTNAPTPTPMVGAALSTTTDGPDTGILTMLLPGVLALVIVVGAFGAKLLRARRHP